MFKGSVNEWTDCKREVRDKNAQKRRDLFINENKGTD